jgi:three-Cys-motif partner protein
VSDPYSGREQTKAKHFILRHYLQELAFKVLTFSDITYVDGFSGPWETRAENFSDSSFMIAISVLKDAQKQILVRTGHRRCIRCFFSESEADAFKQLETAVAPLASRLRLIVEGSKMPWTKYRRLSERHFP